MSIGGPEIVFLAVLIGVPVAVALGAQAAQRRRGPAGADAQDAASTGE